MMSEYWVEPWCWPFDTETRSEYTFPILIYVEAPDIPIDEVMKLRAHIV